MYLHSAQHSVASPRTLIKLVLVIVCMGVGGWVQVVYVQGHYAAESSCLLGSVHEQGGVTVTISLPLNALLNMLLKVDLGFCT